MKKGFTTLELVVVILVFGVLTVLFFFQNEAARAFARDDQRKVAINTIHYTLEVVFFQENGFFPEYITVDMWDEENEVVVPGNVRTLNPELLFDPNGNFINTPDGDFRYEPFDCDDGRCFGYRLSSRMEREGEFVRTSIGEGL